MSTTKTTNWSSDRLKDISAINLSTLPVNTADNFRFRYLEISNVNYYGVISEDEMELLQFADAPSRARRVVREGDVLVSSVRPNLQAVAHANRMVDEPLVCSTGFNVVSPRLERIADRFLYFFLLSEGTRQYFEAVAKGVGYPAIDDKDFCSTGVPFPSLPEQKRIAAYLDASCAAIDRAVETKQKQLETLDTLRKSIIQRAVTQGLNPKVKMKDSGVEWFDCVPDNWKVTRLKQCADLLNGYAFDSNTYVDNGIPVIRIGDIVDKIDLNEVRRVSENFVKTLGRFILEEGDVLIAMTGATIGKSSVFSAPEPCFLNQRVGALRSRAANQKFVFYLVKSGVFREQVDVFCYGSAQPNVGKHQIGNIIVPLPPVEEQVDICAYLDLQLGKIVGIERTIQPQVSTLTAYRKSLIHECVTGKRRISDADVTKVETHV